MSTKFSENDLDATNDYKLLVTDVAELKGMPEEVLQAAQHAAEQDGKTGYQFSLHFPSFFPLLQYAENRSLRETIYRANATKASDLGGHPEWDNSAIIDELLSLRQEEAELLGYQNFAEVSLLPKMAESAAQVESFLLDLAHKAWPSCANSPKNNSASPTYKRGTLALFRKNCVNNAMRFLSKKSNNTSLNTKLSQDYLMSSKPYSP